MFRTQDEIFQFDSVDQIWLCRMIVGERSQRWKFSEDEAAALLWAITNRYLLHRGRRHWPTFVYMLRRFSQPINPRWMKGGDLARKYAGRDEASPARLKRRAQISALPWHRISKKIRNAVVRFCTGRILPPKAILNLPRNRVTNWASYPSVDEKHPGGVWIKGNYFFEDRGVLKPDAVLPDFWR